MPSPPQIASPPPLNAPQQRPDAQTAPPKVSLDDLRQGKPIPVAPGVTVVLDVFADPRDSSPKRVEIPAHHEPAPGNDDIVRTRTRRVVLAEPEALLDCPPDETCQPKVKNPWHAVPLKDMAHSTDTTVRVHNSKGDALDSWEMRPALWAEQTVLHAATFAIDTAERVSGRPIPWGPRQSLILRVDVHGLAGNRAHVDPKNGVIRLGAAPLEYGSGVTGIYEIGRNWKAVAHELWHAIFSALKPFRERIQDNALRDDVFIVNEAFGDVFAAALWLQNKDWAADLLKKTHGNLARSTMLSQLVEPNWTANGIGFQTLRDLWNGQVFTPGKRASPHGPSEALSGALFRVLVDDYEHYRASIGDEAALHLASTRALHRMFRALDGVGEYAFTLENMGRALIQAEHAAFGGRAVPILTAQLARRNIIGRTSLTPRTQLAELPQIQESILTKEDAQHWVQKNALRLSPGGRFGVEYAGFERGSDGTFRIWTRLTHPLLAHPIAGEGLWVREKKGGLRAVHFGLPDGLSLDAAERLVTEFAEAHPKSDEITRFVAKRDGKFALWYQRAGGGDLRYVANPEELTVPKK